MSAEEDGPEGHDEGGQESAGRTGSLGGQVRRVLLGGASALLSTEENIRSALSEVRMPKDAARLLLQQVEKTRHEVTGLVGREVKRALRGADLRGELRRALLGMRIDVRASVRFREDASSPGVQLETRVRPRRRRRPPAQGAPHGAQAAQVPPGPQAPSEPADEQAAPQAPAPPRPEG